jgi:hypothetical protein
MGNYMKNDLRYQVCTAAAKLDGLSGGGTHGHNFKNFPV